MRTGAEQPSTKGTTPLLSQIILVIEDQSTNRMIYTKIATSLGKQVEVHSFEKPTQALLWLKTNPAALIICSLWMSELNAFELLAILRGHPKHAAVLVVVVTADVREGLRDRVLAEGASDFLTTPISIFEMRSKLRRMLMLND